MVAPIVYNVLPRRVARGIGGFTPSQQHLDQLLLMINEKRNVIDWPSLTEYPSKPGAPFNPLPWRLAIENIVNTGRFGYVNEHSKRWISYTCLYPWMPENWFLQVFSEHQITFDLNDTPQTRLFWQVDNIFKRVNGSYTWNPAGVQGDPSTPRTTRDTYHQAGNTQLQMSAQDFHELYTVLKLLHQFVHRYHGASSGGHESDPNLTMMHGRGSIAPHQQRWCAAFEKDMWWYGWEDHRTASRMFVPAVKNAVWRHWGGTVTEGVAHQTVHGAIWPQCNFPEGFYYGSAWDVEPGEDPPGPPPIPPEKYHVHPRVGVNHNIWRRRWPKFDQIDTWTKKRPKFPMMDYLPSGPPTRPAPFIKRVAAFVKGWNSGGHTSPVPECPNMATGWRECKMYYKLGHEPPSGDGDTDWRYDGGLLEVKTGRQIETKVAVFNDVGDWVALHSEGYSPNPGDYYFTLIAPLMKAGALDDTVGWGDDPVNAYWPPDWGAYGAEAAFIIMEPYNPGENRPGWSY